MARRDGRLALKGGGRDAEDKGAAYPTSAAEGEGDMKWTRLFAAVIVVAGVLALLGAFRAGAVTKSEVRKWLASTSLSPVTDGCRKVSTTVSGGNILVDDVVRAHLVAHWCFKGGVVTSREFHTDRWGDASWGWNYEGVSDTVKGGAFGTRYVYRRVYFHFSRALSGFGDHVYPWISMTLRGDGTCNIDRSGFTGSIECGPIVTWP